MIYGTLKQEYAFTEYIYNSGAQKPPVEGKHEVNAPDPEVINVRKCFCFLSKLGFGMLVLKSNNFQ